MTLIVFAIALALAFSPNSFAEPGDPNALVRASDSALNSTAVSFGIRYGLSKSPRFEFDAEKLTSASRPSSVGAQLSIIHEQHFQIGLGFERLSTGYTHVRDDTIFGMTEDFQFTGWLLYLSPSVLTRFGRRHALALGLNVDVGYLWANENFLMHDGAASRSYRIPAIRPKLVVSYDVLPNMSLQMESGWLWAERAGSFYYYDYFGGSGESSSWKIDFSGPFVGSMLTITLPVATRSTVGTPADESDMAGARGSGSGRDKRDVVPVYGIRAGALPASVESRPARWDFNGSYGASITGGIQVSLATSSRVEVGLGIDVARTSSTLSRDTVSGSSLRAESSFLYATVGYDGLPTPLNGVPLGLFLDFGHIWAREIDAFELYGSTYSTSTHIDGRAARIKLTVSRELWREAGVRFELGWLFAGVGEQNPPSISVPRGRQRSTEPSSIDFSGASLMVMLRLKS